VASILPGRLDRKQGLKLVHFLLAADTVQRRPVAVMHLMPRWAQFGLGQCGGQFGGEGGETERIALYLIQIECNPRQASHRECCAWRLVR